MPPVEAAEPCTAVLPQADDADLLREAATRPGVGSVPPQVILSENASCIRHRGPSCQRRL